MPPAASIGSWFSDTALSGSMVLAVPVALVAGLVSFFSPCVVPLLPGYLSYVTGLSGADVLTNGSNGVRGRLFVGTVLFVLGFSVVFIAYGAVFGQIGYTLLDERGLITTVLGVVVIVVGLVFAGVVPWLQRDLRVHRVPAVGLAAAPMLGVLFGFGWTPCVGPTLAAVTSLSVNEASPGRGAFLTFVYCMGLGIPFVVAALSFRWMMGAVTWVRARQVWVMRVGGLMMVAVGVLMLTGAWDQVIGWLRGWVGTYETPV